MPMSSDPQPSSQPSSQNPVFIGPPGPVAQAGFHGWFAPAAGSATIPGPTGPTGPLRAVRCPVPGGRPAALRCPCAQ